MSRDSGGWYKKIKDESKKNKNEDNKFEPATKAKSKPSLAS